MIHDKRYGKIVTLVRHGQADSQISGRIGERLTELGKSQATQICETLSGFALTRVFSSAMPRAVETAEVIARKLGIPRVRQDPALNECVPPLPENHPLLDRIPKEKRERARKTLEDAYRRYFSPEPDGNKDLIVSHGNVIRYLASRSFVKDPSEWIGFDLVYNCSISRIAFDPEGRARLLVYNSTSGMPKESLSI